MDTLKYRFAETPLGEVVVVASDNGVSAVWLVDERHDETLASLHRKFAGCRLEEGKHPFIDSALIFLRDFFSGRESICDFPLDLRGTPFQLRVWEELRGIPRGETTSYAEIARRIGCPKSCRAVGNAVGANPIAVLVPCHRVVRSDGMPGGYRWGVWRKKALLDIEHRLNQH